MIAEFDFTPEEEAEYQAWRRAEAAKDAAEELAYIAWRAQQDEARAAAEREER